MRHRQLLILAFLSLSFLFGFGLAGADDLRWQQIGPQPLVARNASSGGGPGQHSGWINAAAVDPRNANVVYLGTAGGGVWKTTDGGQTWVPLTDSQPSLVIGALALNPTNPDIIYAGTSISNALFSNLGAGILKSSDGGSTWTQLPGPLGTGPGVQAVVAWLAVSPSNGNVVLAFYASTQGAAVYRSADGGNTWQQVLASSTLNAGQVVFDPSNGNVAYATLGGVYKSTDGGNTWESVLSDGPFLGLAVAPSSPETVYVSAVNPTGTQMFKSTDGGGHWTPLPGAPFNCEGIEVNPSDPSMIFVGCFGLWFSTDGGSSWSLFATGANGGIHAAMAFSADGSYMYVGSELGAWKVGGWLNNNLTSTDLNATLAITDFYGISMHPIDPTKAIGGTQSNGVDLYSGTLSWQSVACDNGGEAAFDFLNPSTIYVTCTPAPGILKSTDGGGTFSASENGIDANEFQSGSLPALAMDPANPQRLFVAGGHVWQSTDGAATWTAISPALGPGVAVWQSLAIAPSDPNAVYLGNTNGVWVTTNASEGAGATWSSIGSGLPISPSQCGSFEPNCAYLTRIAVDFSSARTAYATFASYVSGHIYKTTNQGASWTDISGNLPNLKVNDIAIDPDIPDTFYIATERGVYSTADGGQTWNLLGSGLPNVAVTALKLHRPTRILRAATFGRSAWDLQLDAVASPVALSGTSLSFAQAGSKTVTLTNSGTAPLTFYSITAPAGFSSTNTCGVQVLGGGNCVITVNFAPVTAGSFSGSITITDDAPGGPQTISVSGTGTAAMDFSLGMASGASSSATVTAGQSASYALTVTPLGGLNQSVGLSCSGAPSLATCSVAPGSAPMDGTNPVSVSVKVITTAASFSAPRSRPLPPGPPLSPGVRLSLMLILALAAMAWAFTRRKRLDLRRWPSATLVLATAFLLVLALAGCGGGTPPPSNPGTPAGSYTLTVTGTTGSGASALSHSMTLTLNLS